MPTASKRRRPPRPKEVAVIDRFTDEDDFRFRERFMILIERVHDDAIAALRVRHPNMRPEHLEARYAALIPKIEKKLRDYYAKARREQAAIRRFIWRRLPP